MKLQELIMAAAASADLHSDGYAMNDLIEFEQTWSDLLDTQLEDLHLSRLDLEEMEKDYLCIGGQKL